MKIKQYDIQKRAFLYFTAIYYVLMTIDFFITRNPYMAYHSGHAGIASGVYSTAYAIAPSYLLLISLLATAILMRKITVSRLNILLITLMLVSNVVNGTIWENPVNFIYNSMTIILTSCLSYLMYKHKEALNKSETLLKMGNFVVLLSLLGTITAILRPNIYGYFSLTFNRLTRGELTYWRVLGLYVIAAPLSLVIWERTNKVRYIVASMLIWLVCLAQSTRMLAIVSLMPFLLYFLIRWRKLKKIVAIVLIGGGLVLLRERIVDYISLGIKGPHLQESISYVLNGRLELWQYYWDKATLHPIIGNVPGIIERYKDYNYYATSEVGWLKWFAEYGILYVSILSFITIRSAIRAIYLLQDHTCSSLDLLISLIFLAQIVSLPQSYSRILNYVDFLFWCGLFYLYYSNKNN